MRIGIRCKTVLFASVMNTNDISLRKREFNALLGSPQYPVRLNGGGPSDKTGVTEATCRDRYEDSSILTQRLCCHSLYAWVKDNAFFYIMYRRGNSN